MKSKFIDNNLEVQKPHNIKGTNPRSGQLLLKNTIAPKSRTDVEIKKEVTNEDCEYKLKSNYIKIKHDIKISKRTAPGPSKIIIRKNEEKRKQEAMIAELKAKKEAEDKAKKEAQAKEEKAKEVKKVVKQVKDDVKEKVKEKVKNTKNDIKDAKNEVKKVKEDIKEAKKEVEEKINEKINETVKEKVKKVEKVKKAQKTKKAEK
ncbi:MAG: hypothetical protein E7Z86_08670, partial [Methanosphaera stadtmanae]|nr:hypothetical protein [Methanosphaera stadtmanae]